MMMFAGFGVTLRDLPPYLYWGSYVSYLRYGLEGFIGAIYGLQRPKLDCNEAIYCHYK
jgi:ATP-binding cassette, subfamily G (WHITE), member 4